MTFSTLAAENRIRCPITATEVAIAAMTRKISIDPVTPLERIFDFGTVGNLP